MTKRSRDLSPDWTWSSRGWNPSPFEVPLEQFPAPDENSAEEAAEKLRDLWCLGVDPIADVIATLEDHKVHVIEIKAAEQFDGISAVAFDPSNKPQAAAVVSRIGVPGDRQRLNLAHELGHLVLKIPPLGDQEKLAFRFGAAFLAPAASFKRDAGEKRTSVSVDELLILKKRFKMSIQAILRRFRDLQIISPTYYKEWCIAINRMGWRKKEPLEIKPERPNGSSRPLAVVSLRAFSRYNRLRTFWGRSSILRSLQI